MKKKLLAFDPSELLDSDEAIAAYLTQALAEGDTDELLRAIGHVARARGMAYIAEETGLGRESLYKALRPGANPRIDTVLRVCHAIGMQFSAHPIAHA